MGSRRMDRLNLAYRLDEFSETLMKYISIVLIGGVAKAHDDQAVSHNLQKIRRKFL
jgi:hypothetical protein